MPNKDFKYYSTKYTRCSIGKMYKVGFVKWMKVFTAEERDVMIESALELQKEYAEANENLKRDLEKQLTAHHTGFEQFEQQVHSGIDHEKFEKTMIEGSDLNPNDKGWFN